MAPLDTGTEGLSEWRSIRLEEALREYELVGAQPGPDAYIIVAEKQHGSVQLSNLPNIDIGTAIQEFGYTSLSPWTAWTRQELNPKLRDKIGIRQYYDMKRNDGAVRGTLRLVKTPIQSAHWFMVPASESAVDTNIAKFVEDNLFNRLNVDWNQLLGDILLMFDYGYMVFEKVYMIDPKSGKAMLRKLAPRHPLDIQEWIYDPNGGPAGIVMEPYVPYGNIAIYDSTTAQDSLSGYGALPRIGQFIPINKLVIFSFEAEAGDLSGTSILRSAYKHWYYKDTLYKIDAIQKERHGIGVPVIKLPPGFTTADKQLAEDMGRNLRTNDRAHIILPPNWEILFAVLGGNPVDVIKSIEHHDQQLQLNILAPFMTDPRTRDQIVDVFYKSVRYMADSVASIINKFVIPQLVDLNFRQGKYPQLKARRIGEWDDLRTLSFAVRNFVGAGLITPDDKLEAQLRQETDLPPMDMATLRKPPTPQLPGQPTPPGQAAPPGQPGATDANKPQKPKPPKVGPPRQNTKPPVAPPRANAGRDSSGG